MESLVIAASIPCSNENDSIMRQSVINAGGRQGVGVATTENMHDSGNAGLAISAESLFSKAATYNSDESNSGRQYGHYCMQMGSKGGGEGAAAILSAYRPTLASPMPELMLVNRMDNEMIDAEDGRINNNGGIKCDIYDSCVESEVNEGAASSPKQSPALRRSQGWPLMSYSNAGASMNGIANGGGNRAGIINECITVNGSNNGAGIMISAEVLDGSSKCNMDGNVNVANNKAWIINANQYESSNSARLINSSITGRLLGSNNGAGITAANSNGSNNGGTIFKEGTIGSYNSAGIISSSVNGINNGPGMIYINGSIVNAGKKRSRSAPWTVAEMLALIDAKRNERQQSMSYKTKGLKLPGTEKWKLVSRCLESKEMERSGSQCQDKWENMMKDYKAVRDWQMQHCNAANSNKDDHAEGGGGRNYFKHMTNKERKEARLPPQMDEAIFSSLQAIQQEREEQRRTSSGSGFSSLSKLKPPVPPLSSSSASLITDYQLYHHQKNHHSLTSDLPHGSQHLNLNTHLCPTDNSTILQAPPSITHLNANVTQKIDLVSRLINTQKEEITSTTQILQENIQENKASWNRLTSSSQPLTQHPQDGSQTEHITETATLVQVLVALADAVKTVAQKL